MYRSIPTAAILFSALALSACAQDTDAFPSLAKRPAERVTATYGAPQPAAIPIALPQPANGVLAEIDSLIAKAVQADARFRRGEPSAQRLVGQAGRARIGSEPWSIATMAVSELIAARGQAMVPLAELDRQFAEAMTRGEDVTRIADARDRVIAIIARQDTVLGLLQRRLGN